MGLSDGVAWERDYGASEKRHNGANGKSEGWTKKRKGLTAVIHMHPDVREGRAVVENHNGFTFYGQRYATLDDAKRAALAF